MKKIIFLSLFSASVLLAQAQSKSFSPVYATKDGAIHGYDPVAYFTDGKPVKGRSDISVEWGGGTWHFASVAHRDSFQHTPEKYAPAYGGYCAYGCSRGYSVKTEPEAWTIVGGKLYLNYDLDIKADWDKKQEAYIKKADAYWKEVLHQ